MALIQSLAKLWGDVGGVIWHLYAELEYASLLNIVLKYRAINRFCGSVIRLMYFVKDGNVNRICSYCLCKNRSYRIGYHYYGVSAGTGCTGEMYLCSYCMKWKQPMDFGVCTPLKAIEYEL